MTYNANAIPKLLFTYKALVVYALALGVILLVQVGINWLISDNTPVFTGTCSFKEWYDGESLGMVVSCEGQGEDIISNSSFLKSYLENPGPLTCDVYETGSIGCERRPALAVAP